MSKVLLPPIWIIVLLAGLSQLSETIYSPSLPAVAYDLMTTESMAEYTLTIFLIGFAVGTLFWGQLSDRLGRKPCVIGGLIIFIIGCAGCYFSTSIDMLLTSRFIQAFGCSIGSVLGQAIARDAFQGAALGQVYAVVTSALAIFPALGPTVGGVIAEHSSWSNSFFLLGVVAIIMLIAVMRTLPETHTSSSNRVNFMEVASKLLRDRRVLGFGLIVGIVNGLQFSYFAEGSFYLIEMLDISPSVYGWSFIAIAGATFVAGIVSKKMQLRYNSQGIMQSGLICMVVSTAIFSILILIHSFASALSNNTLFYIVVLSHMLSMFGVCLTSGNALALALVDYKWCIGTASSVFGFFYYVVIALLTFGMGYLHNGTLLVMPLYFLGMAFSAIIISNTMLSR